MMIYYMGRKALGRTRLTITLKPEIIKALDKVIDGRSIRNRSHAIEYWLHEALVPRVTKVLILAGGQGVNFRPFTYEIPKGLIPIKGKPLLEHTIDLLKRFGFKDIVLSVGHLGEKIREHFGDGSRFGVKIAYLEQKKNNRGTAGPVHDAASVLGTGTFILMYGDVLADIDFKDLLTFHSSRQAIMTMALASVEKPMSWGMASLKGDRVISFNEKPVSRTSSSHLVNAGVYVCEPEVLKLISSKSERLEKDLFPKIAEANQLYGYPFSGYWYDVSNPKVYGDVLKAIK